MILLAKNAKPKKREPRGKYKKDRAMKIDQAAKELGVKANSVKQALKRGTLKGDSKGGVDDKSFEVHKAKLSERKGSKIAKQEPKAETVEPTVSKMETIEQEKVIDFANPDTSEWQKPINVVDTFEEVGKKIGAITQSELDELFGNYSKGDLWYNEAVGVVQIVELMQAENPKGGSEYISLVWYEPRGADADFVPLPMIKQLFEM